MSSDKYVVITGGAGYIGSHLAVVLLEAGYKVITIDNYRNSTSKSLRCVEKLCYPNKIIDIEADLRDPDSYENVFRYYKPVCVFHLAGLKAVGDSVKNPLEYYENNIVGTLKLIDVMKNSECKSMIFSSSATVYEPSPLPSGFKLTEDSPLKPSNPYGRTKLMIEQILQDLKLSDPSWRVTSLRYFNPIGAHPSGIIGENPQGSPNNLLPYITQVMVGRREKLSIFGNDYQTKDGTGVRDYIHVMDLADSHLLAWINQSDSLDISVYNVGTGTGYSVLDIVNTMEDVSGEEIKKDIVGRRPGDIAYCVASPEKANRELGWVAKKSLRDMCEDSLRWQTNNPKGYSS